MVVTPRGWKWGERVWKDVLVVLVPGDQEVSPVQDREVTLSLILPTLVFGLDCVRSVIWPQRLLVLSSCRFNIYTCIMVCDYYKPCSLSRRDK